MERKGDIYRRIAVRMWGDEKVRELSRPPPNGRDLWVACIAGEQTDIVPGLFKIGEAAWAEQLEWDLKGFREAFAEVSAQGLVKADWKARVVWVPNGLKHNFPAATNVILHWQTAWELIPECELKLEAWEHLRKEIADKGEPWVKAFDKACPKPSVMASRIQKQQQHQNKDQKLPAKPVALVLDPDKPEKPKAKKPPPKPGFTEVRGRFDRLTRKRTGEPPLWSAAASVGCNSLLENMSEDVEKACGYLDLAFAFADRQAALGENFYAANLNLGYLGSAEGINRIRNELRAEKSAKAGPPSTGAAASYETGAQTTARKEREARELAEQIAREKQAKAAGGSS